MIRHPIFLGKKHGNQTTNQSHVIHHVVLIFPGIKTPEIPRTLTGPSLWGARDRHLHLSPRHLKLPPPDGPGRWPWAGDEVPFRGLGHYPSVTNTHPLVGALILINYIKLSLTIINYTSWFIFWATKRWIFFPWAYLLGFWTFDHRPIIDQRRRTFI